MAKNKRGPWAKLEKNWRGTCPQCGRPRVKLMWEINKVKVCKHCKAKKI